MIGRRNALARVAAAPGAVLQHIDLADRDAAEELAAGGDLGDLAGDPAPRRKAGVKRAPLDVDCRGLAANRSPTIPARIAEARSA